MDLGLTGRAVLVTGGTDGLGLATAARLVTEGARVAICGRDPEKLERAAARLGDVLAVRADVSSAADIDRLFDTVTDAFGGLHGLVNNAGRSAAQAFEAIDDDAWHDDFALKHFAAVRTCRRALPLLRAAGGGAIVNVLSIAPKAPTARSMPSSVSRAATMTLTKVLAHEHAVENIRVNAALVGFVESGQWTPEQHQPLVDAMRIPMGRVGRAEEFGDAVAFLLSERASYITGVALNVDGGLSPVV